MAGGSEEVASSSLHQSVLADAAANNEQPTADPGLPLPEHYNHNRLQLMVQDPHHLHAYWEVDPGQVDRLQQHVDGHLV